MLIKTAVPPTLLHTCRFRKSILTIPRRCPCVVKFGKRWSKNLDLEPGACLFLTWGSDSLTSQSI